ncbi:MAG: response regulator transcription factor [Halanaeroarchaeum sp.]
MTSNHDPRSVLIVEDESALARVYADALDEEYEVTIVGTVAAAVASLPAADLVVLDRKLPDGRADDVLDAMADRDAMARVVMVTGVEPDTDIVSMPFAEYLVKPVRADDLLSRVRSVERRLAYDESLQELASLVAKRETLRAEADESVTETEAFRHLDAKIDRLDGRVERTLTEFSHRDFRAAFRHLDAPVVAPDGGTRNL